MPVRRDRKTKSWYFRTVIRAPGKRPLRLFGTPGVPGPFHDLPNTQRGAQDAEHRAITQAMTGTFVGAAASVPTIAEHVDPFIRIYSASHKPSSRKDKTQRLNAYILPVCGHLRLDELRQSHVDQIAANMLEAAALRGVDGRKSVNNTLGVLSALVRYAVTNKIIADPGLKFMIKAQDAPVEALSLEGVDALAEAAVDDPRYRFAILIAADAGLRIGEIRALPRIDMNELAREAAIAWSYDSDDNLTATKGWERRVVPISERAWEAFRAVPDVGPLVFSRLDGEVIAYETARKRIHEIYVAAKVVAPKKPWHSLRHTFGTELANKGTPVHLIRELMGHQSIETTLRYMHTNRDQKRAAIRSLASPRGSGVAVDPKRGT